MIDDRLIGVAPGAPVVIVAKVKLDRDEAALIQWSWDQARERGQVILINSEHFDVIREYCRLDLGPGMTTDPDALTAAHMDGYREGIEAERARCALIAEIAERTWRMVADGIANEAAAAVARGKADDFAEIARLIGQQPEPA